jgi:hypothetical protein
MGFILSVILIIAVAIPICASVIAAGNFTGITATVLGFVTVFLALGAMYLSAVTFLGAK